MSIITMNWYISIYFTFCCLICVCKIVVGVNEQFIEKLALAKNVTDVEIEKIYQEWAIKDYPNFLKSCSMHKSSWELMKYKLILKILSAHTTASSQDYVLSFLGSSVAAGHDSHFNLSYPIVVGNLMRKSFSVLNVNLISRNMALGNNPCMPYDVCVKIFAGLDADVVHWEQTYNCPNSKILEQFVRQSLTIPNQPVVVFSESATAHWKPSKCDKMPPSHLVSGEEKALLDADVVKLVSELNKDEFKRAWGVLHDVSRTYREAGIQTFTHVSHEKYACLGPYIKDWEKGAAAWHPSVIGHRLRASHHAYFWLLCWRDAIVDLVNLASHRPLEAIAKDTTRHISALHRPVPTPIHPTPVPDNIDCLSDYEPRADRGASLKAHVLAGLSTGEASTSAMWKSIIYENLVHENLVKQVRIIIDCSRFLRSE